MTRKALDYVIIAGLGVLFIVASYQRWLPYDLTETLGFVTGAACVYLVVREDIWNFPVGIANDIFFLVLFSRARLFGDAGLQVIYVALGLQGWYLWLHGGRDRSQLHVSHAAPRTLAVLSAITVAATAALALVLWKVRGALPVLDSLTTVLSLVAQYMLNKKYIENWFVWIVADLIYIYVYLSRGLQLTALLYLAFLLLCLAGVRAWLRSRRSDQALIAGAA